jgi:peptidoglycan/xylan/chitin deacetylase (PgdA/CDA1 family)
MISEVNTKKPQLGFRLRNLAYWVSAKINQALRLEAKITVLCYHSISNDTWRFCTPLDDFKKQVEYLRESGYNFITAKQLDDAVTHKLELPKKSVLITFDDGYEDVMNIREYLNEQNISPLMFVLADSKNANRMEMDNQRKLLTIDQIKELQKSGWSIGSHSATHPDLGMIEAQDLENEIVKSKVMLEKVLRTSVDYIAYPKGIYNDKVVETANRAGYRLGFSMDDGLDYREASRLALPRVGVDRSHTIIEFSSIMLPVSVIMRKLLRMTPLAKLI